MSYKKLNVFNGSLEDWGRLSTTEKTAYDHVKFDYTDDNPNLNTQHKTYNDVPSVTLTCSSSPTDTICIDTTHSPIAYTINPDLLKSYRKIVVSDCPKCNSNLPISKTSDKGICKCEYCGKEVYVW